MQKLFQRIDVLCKEFVFDIDEIWSMNERINRLANQANMVMPQQGLQSEEFRSYASEREALVSQIERIGECLVPLLLAEGFTIQELGGVSF